MERTENEVGRPAAKFAAGLFVQVAAWVAAGCIGWFAHAFWGGEAKVAARVTAKEPSVAVDAVKAEKFNPPEAFIGHVEPVQEVDILPQIEGYLKEIRFREGDSVKAGDLLFVIDDEKYAADEGVAKAEVESARSRVVQAEAAVERAERLLRRMKAADARGITQTEMDAAETGLQSDQAALGSAKAAVSQAEAKLALTAFNMKHTHIYAPISGRIGKSLRHTGDYVSPSKEPLARIVQTDPVRVCFPITDRAYLGWTREAAGRGAKVADSRRLRLQLADDSIYPAVGEWEFSDNEMSAETATLIIRARFANAKHVLVPNAYVKVLADESDPKPVPVVPALAMAKRGQATGVWTIGDDNVVHFREVEPGGRADGKVRIEKGLAAGERIVVQGVHKLGDGMKVKVVPASDFN